MIEIERHQQRRLRRTDEGAQLDKIGGPGTIIGLRVAENPIVETGERFWRLGKSAACRRRRAPGHVSDDEGFQPLFRGVGFQAARSTG
jgi:hypothetical protein